MAIGTVETANNGVSYQRGFGKIGRVNHLLGQRGKLGAGQMAPRIQTVRKTDHFSLLIGRQCFQFMDDLTCCHVATVGFQSRCVNPDKDCHRKNTVLRSTEFQIDSPELNR